LNEEIEIEIEINCCSFSQIRKASLVLLGPTSNDNRKKRSISESYAEHPLSQQDLNSLTLHNEIRQLKEIIFVRDEEISRLRREIHKLKVRITPCATADLEIKLRIDFHLGY
jgi:hypothetical protein